MRKLDIEKIEVLRLERDFLPGRVVELKEENPITDYGSEELYYEGT